MPETVLKHAAQVMPYAEHVRSLADDHRPEFGFLPKNAYVEAARRQNLWVAVDKVSSDLLGYLLFGGQHPRMKVFQVCVHPDHRSRGIARSLVSQLIKYGENRGFLKITARVSSKLDANRFWQEIGFHIVKQIRDAGSRTVINLYAMDLDVPSLFGDSDYSLSTVDRANIQIDPRRPLLPTPSYVIDLNVFFDVVRNRDTGQGDQIVSAALRHDIRLFVTPEFVAELLRTSHDQHNDPVLSFARNLPTLPRVEPDRLQHLVAELRRLLFSQPPGPRAWTANDKSDQVHLASSIHHRAFGFITSDSAVLRNSDRLHDNYGLRVLSPTDVADSLRVDERDVPVPMAVTAENREIQVSDINASNQVDVDRFLREREIDKRDGLTSGDPGPAHSPPHSVVVTSSGQVVGVGQWSATPGSGRHAILFVIVDEDHADAHRAIDHILGSVRSTGEVPQLWRFSLRVPQDHIKTIETAIKRGFHPQRKRDRGSLTELIRVSIEGVVIPDDWRRIRRDFLDETNLLLPPELPSHQELINTGIVLGRERGLATWTMSLFDFETFIAPGVLIAPGRGAVIVPIKRSYAEELLPETRDQGWLISRYDAALRLERAYFLGARRLTLLRRGTVVVFYISRSRSQAVALARVTFSDTLTKTQAVMNLSRQGVLTEEEIQSLTGDSNDVTVFTFDNILSFPRSIDFKKLQQMGCVGGANLRTIQRISDQELRRIIRYGFGVNI